jgi:hypothetical protein
VIYPIKPQEPIDNIKELLHTAAAFKGKIYQRRNVPAHMTMAEFISKKDGLKLCANLQEAAPSGSFLCNQLEYMVPDLDFHFQRAFTLHLGTKTNNF